MEGEDGGGTKALEAAGGARATDKTHARRKFVNPDHLVGGPGRRGVEVHRYAVGNDLYQ